MGDGKRKPIRRGKVYTRKKRGEERYFGKVKKQLEARRAGKTHFIETPGNAM